MSQSGSLTSGGAAAGSVVDTGTTTTTDATLTTIITLDAGTTAGTITVKGTLQAFASSGPYSAGFSYFCAYRTDGAAATELGSEITNTFQDPELEDAVISLSVSGNDILLQVQGIAATSVNWNSLLEYRIVT